MDTLERFSPTEIKVADSRKLKKGALKPPLVSVVMFVRNGMPHLKRAVRSVLDQSHGNLEFVIQDGASTDGTVEYLRGLKDARIKVVSEPDDGPADGFARAMMRCKGEIIATCLADEELTPGALERIVELFAENPHIAAITGDAHITDIEGNIHGKFEGAPFNLIDYLWGKYCPYWCSSFFKTEALRFVGLFEGRWSKSSLEFEIWCRLSIENDIYYVPEIFSKYAHHANQLSQNPVRVADEMEARLDIIRNNLFGPGNFFGDDPFRRDVICLLQLRNLYLHLSVWNPVEAEQVLARVVGAGYLGHFNASRIAAGEVNPPAMAGVIEAVHSLASTASDPGALSVLATASPGLDIAPAIVAQALPQAAGTVDGWLIQPRSLAGIIYRGVVPKWARGAIPQNFKNKLAKFVGLGRRRG